jgi:hypothetical protein
VPSARFPTEVVVPPERGLTSVGESGRPGSNRRHSAWKACVNVRHEPTRTDNPHGFDLGASGTDTIRQEPTTEPDHIRADGTAIETTMRNPFH